jgi:hypothetical protein
LTLIWYGESLNRLYPHLVFLYHDIALFLANTIATMMMKTTTRKTSKEKGTKKKRRRRTKKLLPALPSSANQSLQNRLYMMTMARKNKNKTDIAGDEYQSRCRMGKLALGYRFCRTSRVGVGMGRIGVMRVRVMGLELGVRSVRVLVQVWIRVLVGE